MTDQTTAYAPNGTRPADVDKLDHLKAEDLDQRGARIPWGPKPHQHVGPVIAAGMLRLLRERDSTLWAELHYEAATGDRLDLGRRRKTQTGD